MNILEQQILMRGEKPEDHQYLEVSATILEEKIQAFLKSLADTDVFQVAIVSRRKSVNFPTRIVRYTVQSDESPPSAVHPILDGGAQDVIADDPDPFEGA